MVMLGCQVSQSLASLIKIGYLLVLKHSPSLFLCLTVTLHSLNCIILDLMHVHNITPLCFACCYNTALGDNILNMPYGIRSTSLPIYIFYSNLFLFCLLLVSSFLTTLELMLLKLRDAIFTLSIFLSFSSSKFCHLSSPGFCISCIGHPIYI